MLNIISAAVIYAGLEGPIEYLRFKHGQFTLNDVKVGIPLGGLASAFIVLAAVFGVYLGLREGQKQNIKNNLQ